MGYSIGYGFKTLEEAKVLEEKLLDQGHEVVVMDMSSQGTEGFWVRDFGPKFNNINKD